MDVPAGNGLPNPYSDNAAETGQPAFPWRGRITCSPAAGYAGSVDKTAAAAEQVAAFFGAAQPSDFAVSDESVTWTGAPGDWGLRRMILHYAHLCAAAGGVDAFLIGSEMRGLTHDPRRRRQLSGGAGVPRPRRRRARDPRAGHEDQLRRRLVGVFRAPPGRRLGRCLLPPRPALGRCRTSTSSASTTTCRSPTGATALTMPTHRWLPAIYDRDYLQANIAGGEGFDWFYASDADRATQTRTPITDGAAGKPWVFRSKDLRAWWSNPHFNRPGGVESATPTAWVPAVEADPVHRARLPGGRSRHQPAERLLRPEVLGELRAALLARLARRRHAAGVSRGDLPLLGRSGEQPGLAGLRRPHARAPASAPPGPGTRGPIRSSPSSSDVWTDGAELAARALAERAARRGVARRAGARPLPPRRHARRPHRRLRALGRGRGLSSSPRSKARAPRSPCWRGTSASTRSRAKACSAS